VSGDYFSGQGEAEAEPAVVAVPAAGEAGEEPFGVGRVES